MNTHFKFLKIVSIIIIVSGISIFGKCKKSNTTVTPTPAIAKTFSLTLNSSDKTYALKAYTNLALTEAVADISKIDSGKTVYISIPKTNVENKTPSVIGADNIITANLVAVQMTSNKIITANYVLDTANFIYNATFETITGYKGSAKNIEIPATIKGVTVKTIAGPANFSRTGFPITLESVIVPNGVTTIGLNAFDSCLFLISITLPNSITNIGEEAFRNCKKLPNVMLPNSLTSIGKQAFLNCQSFTNIVIPSGVKNIGSYAFFNDNLIAVTIEATTPPILSFQDFIFGSTTLVGANKPITITVPKGTKTAYENAGWDTSGLGRNNITIIEQ